MKRFYIIFLLTIVLIPLFPQKGSDSIRYDIESVAVDSPIEINGNIDFIQQATNKNWPGNGTPQNPFIIQNLVIVIATQGINISNTDLYFIIRNCQITYRESIKLTNVTNAIINSNILAGRITVNYGSKNIIVSNILEYLSIWRSNDNHILNNSIKYFSFYKDWGMQITESERNIFENNTLDGFDIAVRLNDSPNNYFSNNNFTGTQSYTTYCITLEDATFNVSFNNNTIFNCRYAVDLSGNGGNINYFLFNNFINNTYPAQGTQNSDPTFLYNFWSDHNNSDLNGDGYSDSPYIILSGITDSSPRSSQIQLYI